MKLMASQRLLAAEDNFAGNVARLEKAFKSFSKGPAKLNGPAAVIPLKDGNIHYVEGGTKSGATISLSTQTKGIGAGYFLGEGADFEKALFNLWGQLRKDFDETDKAAKQLVQQAQTLKEQARVLERFSDAVNAT